MSEQKRIGEILVELGRITQDQLDEALAVQSRPNEKRMIGQILVSRGYVSPAVIKAALGKQRRCEG